MKSLSAWKRTISPSFNPFSEQNSLKPWPIFVEHLYLFDISILQFTIVLGPIRNTSSIFSSRMKLANLMANPTWFVKLFLVHSVFPFNYTSNDMKKPEGIYQVTSCALILCQFYWKYRSCILMTDTVHKCCETPWCTTTFKHCEVNKEFPKYWNWMWESLWMWYKFLILLQPSVILGLFESML